MKFLLYILLLFTPIVEAKDTKIELGAALVSLYYPDYIGSKSYNYLTLPLPYIQYSDKYITLDKSGLHSKLFGIKNLHIELSASGSLPANTKEGTVRDGMPDLDSTGEIGFQLIYDIYHHGKSRLAFEFPLRSVISTDFTSLKYRGILSNPQLKYSLSYEHLRFTLRAGLLFADKNYNHYFYDVAPQYVTQNRARYTANGGFDGFRGRFGFEYQKKSWWYGGFISYFNISNSVAKLSPLIEVHNALYGGVSTAYIFYTN